MNNNTLHNITRHTLPGPLLHSSTWFYMHLGHASKSPFWGTLTHRTPDEQAGLNNSNC